jgi:uncharacterized membrane protein YdjX (TVP38/TMEM64 family)
MVVVCSHCVMFRHSLAAGDSNRFGGIHERVPREEYPPFPVDATSAHVPAQSMGANAASRYTLDLRRESIGFSRRTGTGLHGQDAGAFRLFRRNRRLCLNTQRYGRILLLVGLAAGIALAVLYRDRFDPAALQSRVQEAGIAAPLLFMLIYALAAVLFLPGSVLTLAGGALFGPVFGTLYNLTGATAGAALAFLIARYLASDWVARRAGGRIKQLIDGVESEGWRFVAFVRLVPLFPFNLLNYALGLTRLKFSHYLIATYVFMLPGAVAYTYLGYAGREAVAGGEGLIRKGLLALALLAIVAFLPRLIRTLRGKRSNPVS